MMGNLTSFNIEDRLKMKSRRTVDGCVEWTGCVNEKGYGRTTYKGGNWRVHRLVWHLAGGDLPEGLYLDHTCHNRKCFNVEHLRLTTPKENVENFGGLPITNTSGYRGVSEYREGIWRGRVKHNGREYSKGAFTSALDAHRWVVGKRNELHTHNNLDRNL